MYKNNKYIVVSSIIFGLLVVFLIVIAIVNYLNTQGKIKVSIQFLPTDAKVYVDGTTITGDTTYLTPGEHTFVASKAGFADDKQVLSISKDINVVGLAPNPQSNEAIQWASDPSIQAQREAIGTIAASSRGNTLTTNNPIITQLPYVDISGPFAIDYGYTGAGNTSIYLSIHDSTPHGRQGAIDWIKSQGFDPATLDIRFDGFNNPLTAGNK